MHALSRSTAAAAIAVARRCRSGRWRLASVTRAFPCQPQAPRTTHASQVGRSGASPSALATAVLLGLLAVIPGMPTWAAAQGVALVPPDLLEEVMPEADRFSRPEGAPPVRRAYRTEPDGEQLIGYVFLTSDLPPEQFGYSGPIEALVGMDLEGTLTGVRVTDYYESYRSSMGDFLRRPGFQEQYGGKHISEPFRVWGDIDGISRVSISVRALSRGVRDAARKVAAAYAAGPELPTSTIVDVTALSWFEMRQTGVVERIEITEPGEGSVGISLVYVGSDRIGALLLGDDLYERALQAVERRGGADHLMLYGLDGARLRLFVREGWSWVQGTDTVPITPGDIVTLGLPAGGLVATEATMVGLMILDGPLDITRPFSLRYDAGGLGVHTAQYATTEARMAAAEAVEQPVDAPPTRGGGPAPPARAEGAAEPDVAAEADGAGAPVAEAAAAGAGTGGAATAEEEATGGAVVAEELPAEAAAPERAAPAIATDAAAPGPPEAPAEEGVGDSTFSVASEETLLERTLSSTSWNRMALLLVVLGLASAAFAAKQAPMLRWTALGATLVLLGFVDGGFLSISHVTSGIWVGASVYAADLPLLLLVSFTVVTTLVWGRVFCGFLCPFGALQDVLDRVVPARLKRSLPPRAHGYALKAKYGVLAIIIVPAATGSHASVYQYFEPFGTVFFLSPDLVLWVIAGSILVASAVVPRFYCRYACPLGAALAVVSLVSLRRIRRVEQCDVCKVCEQRCPTGAIRGPRIDFHECVRCNVCEVQLLERRGVCAHDMEDVRSRLVQLRLGTPNRVGAVETPR